MTSYLHTLLTVQDPLGGEVFFNMSISPVSISASLTPATNYSITFTFVFVGGEEGTPLTLFASTADGGMYYACAHVVCVYLINLPSLLPSFPCSS